LAANTQAYSHVAAHASRACPVAYDTEAAPVTSYTITITPDGRHSYDFNFTLPK